MKKGIRILGIDDAPFSKNDRMVLVVGVVWRDGVVEGVLSTVVERDGGDSTGKVLEMIEKSRFKEGLRLIMVHSITLAGFNILDIKKLEEKTGIPVVTLVKRKPDLNSVRKALQKLSGFKEKLELVKKAGPVRRIGKYYAQLAGISVEEAERMVEFFGVEPLRLAHLIASGIVRGESCGRM